MSVQMDLFPEMAVEEQPKERERISYTGMVMLQERTRTATQVGADYGLSARKLNALLADLGVQYKRNGQWELTPLYRGKGYTVRKQAIIHTQYGPEEKANTEWTQKGRILIYQKLAAIGVHPKGVRK